MTDKISIYGLTALVCALCLAATAQAQTSWWRTYGGTSYDCGNSVQQTSDSGYIVACETYSLGPVTRDVYLIKTDASGDTLWTRIYGRDEDQGLSVQQTSDGGYIVAGETYPFGAAMRDVYLIKTDANGDTLWTRTYGGTSEDFCYSVWQTADGGYIIVGRTESYGAGRDDVWLLKTDANGDTLWTRTYGGTSYEGGNSVRQTPDGGYIIAASTASYGEGDFDIWLIKTDAQGYAAPWP